MIHKNHQIKKHEFDLLQKHAETDHKINKKIILATIALIRVSLRVICIIWSYMFSRHNFA